MLIERIFYSKSTIRGKVTRIENQIKRLLKSEYQAKSWIFLNGTLDFDPEFVTFWICVKSDEQKNRLKSDSQLMKKLWSLLIQYDYPMTSDDHVYFDFESDETIKRESRGNWWVHFKK